MLRKKFGSVVDFDDYRLADPGDIHEVLDKLVPLLMLPEPDEEAAYYIVYNIDSSGHLRIGAGEISEKFGIPVERAEELIELVLTEFAEEISRHSHASDENSFIVPDLRMDAEKVEVVKIDVKDPLVQKAMQMREETLIRIGELVRGVNRYFLTGYRKYPQTLTMTFVARRLGLSVSTVSRAVGGKYVETPRGTFPFRIFFGRTPNKEFVVHEIRELLNAYGDLTDQQLSLLLKSVGLDVSRRTVNKYRNSLRPRGGRWDSIKVE